MKAVQVKTFRAAAAQHGKADSFCCYHQRILMSASMSETFAKFSFESLKNNELIASAYGWMLIILTGEKYLYSSYKC